MKPKALLFAAFLAAPISYLYAQSGNVGIGTTTPGTKLDVNGAITNRETAVAVTANTAIVPSNVSQVQLTGAPTAAVAITAPAAPNAGQRLIVFNNTTGGFSATLGGFTVPNGQAMEFTYSNGAWQATNGGAIRGDYDWMKSGNVFPNSPGDTAQSIYHIGANVGIGTDAPGGPVDVVTDNRGSAAGNDFYFKGYGDSKGPGYFLMSASGTRAAPTNLVNNDLLGGYQFGGWVNGGWNYGLAAVQAHYKGDGTTGLSALTFLTSSNQERMRIDETGNVGIGTTTPTNKLEINNGSTAGAIKIVDGTQGSNKVLSSDANGVGSWRSLPGSWFGLLNGGTASTQPSQIDFTSATLIGQGGAANSTTDAITVPSTGLYEVTVSGWTWIGNGNTPGVYLTTWNIRRNGVDIVSPHYASPSGAYGTETSTTNYLTLNAGDVITLFLVNPFGSPQPADQAQRVALGIKLIQ